jgi:electron-transferring-flavoprotein dehydrogenase
MRSLKLREKVGADAQTYGLGIKEVWRVRPEKHTEGLVEHSIGYPLDQWTYGGGFVYHMSEGQVAVGLIIGLDYSNTFLSPYEEFQRWKKHPHIHKILEGGTCIEYGARSLNEGASQFPSIASFLHVHVPHTV